MKKNVKLLKKVAESFSDLSVMAPCFPMSVHQPKPPAKIQKKIMENK